MECHIGLRFLEKALKSSSFQTNLSSLLGGRCYSNRIRDEKEPDGYNKFGQRPNVRQPDSYEGHGRSSFQGYGQRGSYQGYGQRNSYQGYGQRGSYQGYGQRDSFQSGAFIQKRRSNMIMDMPIVNWNTVQLEPTRKNFYVEPAVVSNRPSEEIEEFRKKHDIVIEGDNKNHKPILQFSDYQFPSHIQAALDNFKFEAPLPIQSETWPLSLSGMDLIGIGQTGSGKTLGFVLPAIIHGINQINENGVKVVVLAPTRELAQQINTVFSSICRPLNIGTACIYGGAPKSQQIRQLQTNPMIIVATPGRLMDILAERFFNLKNCTYFILDEADRMLDMGFEPQIRKISEQIRPDRQTSMFSATWPRDVRQLAKRFTAKPAKISIGATDLSTNSDITQEFIFSHPADKPEKLIDMLQRTAVSRQKVLIFAEKRTDVESLCFNLNKKGFNACELHGGHAQRNRDLAINNFRSGHVSICVATDVASRGLDVPDITMVVNYQMPSNIESYVHRIGRTARAGKKGTSITFLSPADMALASDLVMILRKSGQKVPAELQLFPGRMSRNRQQ